MNADSLYCSRIQNSMFVGKCTVWHHVIIIDQRLLMPISEGRLLHTFGRNYGKLF